MKIQSMTGYGSAEERGFRIEIRSVNHRFLDIHFKMPALLNPYELTLRKIVKKRFVRGRIDITISFTDETDITIGINKIFAERLLESLKGLQDKLSLKFGPSLDHILWFRDIIFSEEPKYNPDDLITTFTIAVDKLADMRMREGEHLVEELLNNLNTFQKHLDRIKEFSQEILIKNYKQIKERIIEILKDVIDENRILQEAALIAERADISEELTRIQSHINQMRKIISEDGTIGRKTYFLLQELFREINTIGSKSNEYRISELVIQMKTEIEKVKEQIQNIQ